MKTFFTAEQVSSKRVVVVDNTNRPERFGSLMVDPPWPYAKWASPVADTRKKWQHALSRINAPRLYDSMTIEELKALGSKFPTLDNSHVYMWVTNAFLEDGYEIVRAWGYKPKCLLTWVKLNSQGKVRTDGVGYYYRGATEHMIFGVKGSQRLMTREAQPNAFLSEELPHSVKPPWAYRLIEKCSPGPYLEVFSRTQRPGWFLYGDQIKSKSPCPIQ